MKKLNLLPLCLGCIFAATTSRAIDLKQSKITQVVKDVQIISAADQKQKTATVNDVFAMPDILRTGTGSRAELVAQDATVTRVGANTIFSFDPANRTIDLKQGSLLFHAPRGKGGGTIHTGSATASVLGTTLIVTTTPNGGMKVLSLEGQVEVKFLNGLKQKLDPGQMTFILPGGNQLAPVIIFRLDELIQNSQLVKGFNLSLDSLPLIKIQIEKQIKQIQSGKATDTGLYAGDDASPNQVEVLDPNTLQQMHQEPSLPPPPDTPPAPPSLDEAKAADATINQPSLTDGSIPTPPDHVFISPPFALAGNGYFGLQTFSGFVARNIFMNTPAAGLDPLVVNLSPYSSLASFDLVAVNNFLIEGPVTFNGLSTLADLALIAGNQFVLTPGITVRADTHDFLLSSATTLTLDNVMLQNFANNLSLNSGADVSVQNGSLLYAQSKLTLKAGYNISTAGSQIAADSALFMSLNGSITLADTTLDLSGHVIFIAPTAINLNSSTINAVDVVLSGSGAATAAIDKTTINAPASLTVLAGGDINITDSTLNSDAGSGVVNMTSITGSTTVTGTAITAHDLTVSAGNSIFFEGATENPEGKSAAAVNGGSAPVTAQYLRLNSGDGILLNASGHRFTADAISSATANFSAPNLIAVNNTDFSSYSAVNMAANTINLSDVSFGSGSAVTLRSLLGLLNLGSSVPGNVNFIRNVTYGGYPAQDYVNNGGPITVTTLK